MNYIKHLTTVFQQFSKDSRLNPSHISLYLTLFQHWNFNRFSETFYLNRGEVMKMAKIGSLATYHRCLRELNDWKYISYRPSHNIYKGSKIRMFIFETTSETTCETTPGTTAEQQPIQPIVHNINNNKHELNINKQRLPKDEFEVLEFFKKENSPVVEAKKFFNHYNSLGWKIGGKVKIIDWQSLAKKWILNIHLMDGKKSFSPKDNLTTIRDKNYDEPL